MDATTPIHLRSLAWKWTPKQEQLLALLWPDRSVQLQDIVSQFPGMTRNAVVGKAHRMKLAARRQPGDPNAPKRPRVRLSREPLAPKRVDPPIVRIPVPTIDDLTIPQDQRKALLDLTATDCRWPVGHVGEPDFFFCGAPKMEGKSYCAGHCARAFTLEPTGRRYA